MPSCRKVSPPELLLYYIVRKDLHRRVVLRIFATNCLWMKLLQTSVYKISEHRHVFESPVCLIRSWIDSFIKEKALSEFCEFISVSTRKQRNPVMTDDTWRPVCHHHGWLWWQMSTAEPVTSDHQSSVTTSNLVSYNNLNFNLAKTRLESIKDFIAWL